MQWAIDTAHSQIQFAVKHLGISTVRGTFPTFSGSITEDNGIVSAVNVDLEMASLNTGMGQRDEHLRSGDFFDTTTYPKATFSLTRFDRQGDDVVATGALTVVIDRTFPLAEAAAAHEFIESRQAVGRVVLIP